MFILFLLENYFFRAMKFYLDFVFGEFRLFSFILNDNLPRYYLSKSRKKTKIKKNAHKHLQQYQNALNKQEG